MNEKSDFETFHVTVIVLVRGQNDHLPQVDNSSTCGEKAITNQVDILPTRKQKKRIDIHQSASNIVMLFFVRFPAVPVRALLLAELSFVRPAA